LTRISIGIQDYLYLGNINARRDWGHARDYVEMQWLMLQQQKPADYVIATGRQYSVRDFVSAVANELDMEITWRGEGVEEKGFDRAGKCIVQVDPEYYRPAEVETLLGDASRAARELGWSPRTSFEELVREMVAEDLTLAKKEDLVRRHGYKATSGFE